MPEAGYAAIYPSGEDGRPAAVPVGYAKLAAGEHREFKIELQDGAKAGDKLWVALYRDGDNSSSFDPGKGDVAYGSGAVSARSSSNFSS